MDSETTIGFSEENDGGTERFLTRGSALPETAFTMSLVLLIFLGLIKLTFVGYEQSEMDAVSFVAAHAAAMNPSPAAQMSHSQVKVQAAFPRFPVANLGMETSQPGATPNPISGPNGSVVGYAHLISGGLFVGQSFGGSVFTLRSHIVEPTVAVQPGVLGSGLTILVANPPNCTSNNPATSSTLCSTLLGLAVPDPTNTADPYYAYSCHAAYYAALSNSYGFPPDPTRYFAPQIPDLSSQYPGSAIDYTLPDAPSLSALQDNNGNLLAGTPWPTDFSPTVASSINSIGNRSGGTWLTAQFEPDGVTPDPANQDGKAIGGKIGTALIPIFSFGGVTQGGGGGKFGGGKNPC